MKKTLVWLAGLLGIAFVVLSYIYFTTPAQSLPAYFPGYDPALVRIHLKHGIAALLLGLACFAYAWFGSAKKK